MLNNNKLSFFNEGTFLNLKNLLSLDLGDNLFNYLGNEFFKGLENLHTLNLKQNQIKKIEKDSFSPLKNLNRNLDLDFQNLNHIIPYTFINQNKLEDIYLSHNSLTILYNFTFNGLNEIRIIDIGKNKITKIQMA